MWKMHTFTIYNVHSYIKINHLSVLIKAFQGQMHWNHIQIHIHIQSREYLNGSNNSYRYVYPISLSWPMRYHGPRIFEVFPLSWRNKLTIQTWKYIPLPSCSHLLNDPETFVVTSSQPFLFVKSMVCCLKIQIYNYSALTTRSFYLYFKLWL